MFSLKTQVTEDLNWFVVLSGTSSALPLETFYQHGGKKRAVSGLAPITKAGKK